MNERIRILQLADQAYEESLTDTTKYEVNIPDEFCKKFAELIVRECVAAVLDLEMSSSGFVAAVIEDRLGYEQRSLRS